MPVFEPVDTALNFPQLEAKVLEFWKQHGIFHKSLKAREGAATWVFYEGPPTANGKPHPGHALTRAIKDLFPRYKTMRGFHVPRKGGWDTHGLPVEIEVEKELKINGKDQIEAYGVEAFVKKCMDSVFRYTADWEEFTEKLGFWIDLPDAYVTYHKSYVESVWWSLQQLHQKGLLYQGHKILPWCPRCGTALSSHEVGQGYKDVEDPSVFITFRSPDWATSRTSFLAWTTTPWTLPSNAGLAVKADAEYSHVKVGAGDKTETLIMASALVKQVMGKLPYEVVKTEAGEALVGRRYQPLFDYWKGSANELASAWKVCAADFVALDTGSGLVHMAPAFGADDYALGQKEGLPVIQLVNAKGCFTPECGPFAGRFVKDADNDLLKDLRQRGLLLKREVYKHPYPFCWRCTSPLIYFARAGWFIRTTQEIEKVIANNKTVQWVPEHIRDGRFGNFLEANVDWALSRERYWGTPLPIWKCKACGVEKALGSFNEIMAQKNARGTDAFDHAKAQDPALNEHLRVHKPWIDEAAFDCEKCGQEMRRVPEVIDCWYDSGAMPFAQWGYPHAEGSHEKFEKMFPADFISEAIDQTRGWFYSLLTESTLLFNGARQPNPYKTCLVLGHVCDEKGEKMSKSKGNYIDPMLILREEGADALRWFFYSATNPWTSARFSRPNVREAQKEFLIKLRNVYSFFVIYANIDGFDPCEGHDAADHDCDPYGFHRGGQPLEKRAVLDRWVLSEVHQTTNMVRQRLDEYDVFGAAQHLSTLADSLSNWYVQRTRERYWRSWRSDDRTHPEDLDKLDAYWTLYESLVTMARLIAPFVPFTAEELWQNLVCKPLRERAEESVHLCAYPITDPHAVDRELADEVALVRDIVSLGRNVRAAQKKKVRLPLSRLILVLAAPAQRPVVQKHEATLAEALNVKTIEYARVADQYVTYELKPNLKLIGAKYRELVPAIKATLGRANAAHLKNKLATDGHCILNIEGQMVDLTAEEVEVSLMAKEGFAAAGSRSVVVVLDTTLTPELLEEGLARELVSRVQKLRGELDLNYEQRIQLAVKSSDKVQDIVRKFEAYIKGETLAAELVLGTTPDGWTTSVEELKDEAESCVIAIQAQ